MMMRRVLPYAFLGALCIALYSYSRDNREDIKIEYGHHNIHEPFTIELETYDNRYICNDCDMMLKTYKHSAQVVTKKGKVYLFDDVGCMINWLEKEGFKEEQYQGYVYAKDTNGYIPSELAWYIRDGNTPLGYGFEAYETSMAAMASAHTSSKIESQVGTFTRKEGNVETYEYDEIKEFCLRGETLLHPMIKKELLIRK